MLQFEPGYYTKIRIDDEGKIIDTSYLEEVDLPDHKHSFNDITDPQFVDERIKSILSTFFTNDMGSAVKFTYDKSTGTVSADVDIDETSVYKNEWGQLASKTSEVEDSSNVNNTQTPSTTDIKAVVTDILKNTFINNNNSLIDFNWDNFTNTVSADLKYDGVTLTKDEYGNLIVGDTSGSQPDCASHSHTSASIEDFNEEVLKIFNEYKNTIDIDISNYIDGSTIKLNKYGKLVAVSSALEKHTHTLKDIVDYNEPLPAALQPIKDLGDEIDYNEGVIDFSDLNLGYSILALSKYIQDSVNANIEKLSKKISNGGGGTSNKSTSSLSLSVLDSCISNNLLDTSNNLICEVFYGPSLFLCISNVENETGELELVINEKTQETVSLGKLNRMGATEKCFTTISLKGNKKNIKIAMEDFIKKEGKYEIQAIIRDEEFYYTNTISLMATPIKELKIKVIDVTPVHTINNKEYYSPGLFNYKLTLEKSRFINNSFGFCDFEFYGSTSERNSSLCIPNLFNSSYINLEFEKETEESTSYLFNSLIEVDGTIVNDVILKDSECRFLLKDSKNKNAIRLFFNDPIDDVTFIKENKEYKGSMTFENNTGCYYFRDERYFVFGDSYDSGNSDIEVIIKATEDLDISNWNFEYLNM